MRIVWSFIQMKMVKRQIRLIQKVRREEVQLKVYFQALCIGRGTASVAEQIHSTVEEAQQIIDSFFEAYPKIKQFVEQKQKEAHKRGFTETAWGRRRYIKHVTDDRFEYKYNSNRPIDFNPLFTAKSIFTKDVSDDIKDEYNQKLSNANHYQRNKIIEQARKDGIDIIDNSGFIAEANRQVVNSIIQGSASDITKIAMIKIGQNEELKRLGYKMLFPVHDEIIAECPFENRKRCGELMSQLMIDSAKEHVDVPMKCDVERFYCLVWRGC